MQDTDDCINLTSHLYYTLGLHLLLRARALALGEAAEAAAELPAARGPRSAVAAQRVPGDDPEQGAGATQVEEGAALQRQEQRPLRGHLAHHPQRQRTQSAREGLQSGEGLFEHFELFINTLKKFKRI